MTNATSQHDPAEARVRASLQRWADTVQPEPGDAFAAMHAGPASTDRRAWRSLAVGIAAAGIAVVGIGVAAGRDDPPASLHVAGSPGSTGPGHHGDAAGSVPDPTAITATSSSPPNNANDLVMGRHPTVVFRPGDAGWLLVFISTSHLADGRSHTSYQFAHPDGRRFELNLYPLGERTTPGTPTAPPPVSLRGTQAGVTDEGPPRYRLTWDEAGRTWEADGEPFSSNEDLARTLEGFVVVDEAEWRHAMPAEFVAALDADPAGATWRYGIGTGGGSGTIVPSQCDPAVPCPYGPSAEATVEPPPPGVEVQGTP